MCSLSAQLQVEKNKNHPLSQIYVLFEIVGLGVVMLRWTCLQYTEDFWRFLFRSLWNAVKIEAVDFWATS